VKSFPVVSVGPLALKTAEIPGGGKQTRCSPAARVSWSVIFPENRFPLFGIML
jgi:hypothetical protein